MGLDVKAWTTHSSHAATMWLPHHRHSLCTLQRAAGSAVTGQQSRVSSHWSASTIILSGMEIGAHTNQENTACGIKSREIALLTVVQVSSSTTFECYQRLVNKLWRVVAWCLPTHERRNRLRMGEPQASCVHSREREPSTPMRHGRIHAAVGGRKALLGGA